MKPQATQGMAILLDFDPCDVWPDDSAACAQKAVEQLVFCNRLMPDLAVCAEHVAQHRREHLL